MAVELLSKAAGRSFWHFGGLSPDMATEWA